MKLLLDINVLLDVILRREPWARESAPLLTEVAQGGASGYVSSHTVTTIFYLVSRARDRRTATGAVVNLLRIVETVPIGDADFQRALTLRLPDFEDAVQAAAAIQIEADFLVTRNTKDFREAGVPVRTPGEVLALLQQ